MRFGLRGRFGVLLIFGCGMGGRGSWLSLFVESLREGIDMSSGEWVFMFLFGFPIALFLLNVMFSVVFGTVLWFVALFRRGK